MNLIVTCARHLEPETEEEVKTILEEIGEVNPTVRITEMSGILTVDTALNPIDVVSKIREKILDEPWSIRYCLRIIPIQKSIDTDYANIENEIVNMVGTIADDESYRITIEKRNSDISSKEIISRIANCLKNRVSLDNPDKIILVEILGRTTGLAIIQTSDILSIEKTKRAMSE